jgi:hypothetical protein
VRSRLARARDRLRARLQRRGLATAGLPALLNRPDAGTLPPGLIHSTARAALTLAVRDAVESGLVSASAASLSQGVLRTMLFAKLKTAAVALVATAAVTAGAGVYAFQDTPRDNAPLPRRVEPPRAESPPADKPPVNHFSITVTLPDGLASEIEKLAAEANRLHHAGDIDGARDRLDRIRSLADLWSQHLEVRPRSEPGNVVLDEGPRAGQRPGRRDEPRPRATRNRAVAGDVVTGNVPLAQPLDRPEVLPPSTRRPLNRVPRDTDARLDALELKVDRLLKALESQRGPQTDAQNNLPPSNDLAPAGADRPESPFRLRGRLMPPGQPKQPDPSALPK